MKKILLPIILLTSFLLTGCLGFGGDEESTPADSVNLENQPSKVAYETDAFLIIIDKDWESIEPDSFTSNIPQETIVGFRNNLKNQIFTANLNIGRFVVEEGTSSLDVAKRTISKAKQRLNNFKQTQSENYTLENGENDIETVIYDFEGKKTASEEIVHFRQLYVVNNTDAFTITAAYLPSEEESVVNLLDEMLKSFRLR